ncbi:MAG: DUF2341 domain-containing protein, partial [Candidatus Parvarchaeota archaeon]|nr:DUF2341 domain-containing protein [Candidatus Parvarchaeum tengchongense]
MKKISIALSVIFFFLFLKAGYALPSIVCDKDVYVALQKFDAFCNITNDLNYGITVHNYTLLFPINGVIFEPFVKKNVTYNVSIPIYEPCLQNFTVNGSWVYNETDGLYYFNGSALNCTNIYSINQTNDTCEYETQCYAGNTEEERWRWDFVPLELPFNMNASETKEFLFKVSVPIGSSGKFNVTASIFYDNENITASLDPWWNSAWLMRRNITINNTVNSNTLADYQIPINLTYDSDIQPDFSDIRFTWYNSTDESETEIPYWIESKVDSQWAYVWVK